MPVDSGSGAASGYSPDPSSDFDIEFAFTWLSAETLILTDGACYVSLRVAATQGGEAVTASNYDVEVAFAASRSAARTWHALEWVDTETARLLVGDGTAAELAAGNYYRFVRATAAPELEVVQLPGVLEVL